jgi:predicted secreted protein
MGYREGGPRTWTRWGILRSVSGVPSFPSRPGSRARGLGLLSLASICLTMFFGSSSWATEASSWDVVGFSADGSHVAVDIHGWHDGCGCPYSSIRILQTKTNRFVDSSVETTIEDGSQQAGSAGASEEEARKRNRLKAMKLLARYHIDDRLPGDRPKLSDRRRVPADRVRSQPALMARESVRFRWRDSDFTLVLQEVAAPNGEDEGYGRPRMLDLRLKRDGKETLLQKDRRLPTSRGLGVYVYNLVAVVTYETAIMVVVSYAKPGYEGPDTSQLFIAAQIP